MTARQGKKRVTYPTAGTYYNKGNSKGRNEPHGTKISRTMTETAETPPHPGW